MRPPFISYVACNRMGLTAGNLLQLLKSKDDFELHMVDNHSSDDTWELLKDLSDPRIKSRLRMDMKKGTACLHHCHLKIRQPDQFFVTLKNDICIHSLDWIAKFMKVFDTFTEVGMLGIPNPDSGILPEVVPRLREGACYLRLKRPYMSPEDMPKGFLMFRPEIFNYMDSRCEENGQWLCEIFAAVAESTPYTIGLMPNIRMERITEIPCMECKARHLCSLKDRGTNCFQVWEEHHG